MNGIDTELMFVTCLTGQCGNLMLQFPVVHIKSNSFLRMTGECFHEYENSPVLKRRRAVCWRKL